MFGKAAPGPIIATQHIVTLAPSNESYVDSLRAQFPEYSFGAQPAVESQQLDASEKQAAIDDMQNTLDGYLKSHPHTGPMNVYLLDGKGVAGMDEQNEGPLRAVVAQVIADPSHTVAALLPEDQSITKAEDLSPSSMLRALAETVLSVESATLLIGREALESYLIAQRYTSGVTETSPFPSSESFTDEAAEGEEDLTASNEGAVAEAAIFAGAVVTASLVVHGIRVLTNKSIDLLKAAWRGRRTAETVKKTKEIVLGVTGQLKRTFANEAWVSQQNLVTGPISSDGIAAALVKGNAIPAQIAPAALAHSAAVFHAVDTFAAKMSRYVSQANPIAEAMVKMPDIKAAVDYGNAKVAALPNPQTFVTINTLAMLGNPTLTKDEHDTELEFHGKEVKIGDLPALNQAQLVACAKALSTLLTSAEQLEMKWRSIPHLHDGEDSIFNRTDHVKDLWQEMVGQSVCDVFWHGYHFNMTNAALYTAMDSVTDVAKALELWMRRSIKA